MQRQLLAGGIAVERFRRLSPARVKALVSTRHGGVSGDPYGSLNLGLRVGDEPAAVIENRRRLFAAAGLSLERSVWCRQVHDNSVSIVEATDIGRGALDEQDIVENTDALVTDLVDVPLCVIVADCVPVVIYDPGAHALGVAHAGWAGTVERIASAMVRVMSERWGSEPGRMLAAIGPSIGPDEYEVGDEVAEAARAAYGGAADAMLSPKSDGKQSFDLWAANLIDLTETGIPSAQIEVARLSSAGKLEDFYSHRAEGSTGRFAAIASLCRL